MKACEQKTSTALTTCRSQSDMDKPLDVAVRKISKCVRI